jgi:hypothetical protein
MKINRLFSESFSLCRLPKTTSETFNRQASLQAPSSGSTSCYHSHPLLHCVASRKGRGSEGRCYVGVRPRLLSWQHSEAHPSTGENTYTCARAQSFFICMRTPIVVQEHYFPVCMRFMRVSIFKHNSLNTQPWGWIPNLKDTVKV